MIRSAVVVSLLAAFGSVISFAGQLVLAQIFGAGEVLDAYLVGISLPLTVTGLIGGVLGYQVVPALLREQTATGSHRNSLIGMILGLGSGATALALVGILSSAWIAPLLAKDLPATIHGIVLHASWVAWTWLPLGVAGAILTGGMHAEGKFALATLLQPLPPIGAMLGCLFWHESHGVLALAVGQLVGYVLMVLLLAAAQPLSARPDWKQTRHILRESPIALTALLVFVIYPLPDAIWGPHAGAASVSLLGYAQRLVVGFAGLAVVGSSTVLFPRLARQAASGEHVAFTADLSRSFRIMLACMAPAAAVLGVLALPIVRFLFLRGAFGEAEAVALAELLPWMFGGMVAMSCMTLAFKALFAQGRVLLAASYSAMGAMIYFTFAGLLVIPFGLPGIGAAYMVTWWTVLGLAMWTLQAATRQDIYFVVRLSVVTILCGAVASLGREILIQAKDPDQWHALFTLTVTAAGSIVVYLAASLVWPGLEDIQAVALVLRTKKKHKSHEQD